MITMSDVAERVGVSRATVSYVLNERETGISIREETRQRILETASEMGYRRNDLARAVVTGKTFVLGFLTHSAGSDFTSRIMVGAQDEADLHGYQIKLVRMVKEQEYEGPIQRCIEQRVAGIICITSNEAALEHLGAETTNFNIPVVLVDNSPAREWALRVVSDSEQGLGLAIEHLRTLGHERIAFLTAQLDAPLARTRQEMFANLTQKMGLQVPPEHILATNWSYPPVIEEGVRALLSGPGPRPTAIMCAGDKIAMVAVRTLRALGVRVPEEISVMGFSDLGMALYADPPLTTIRQPYEDMGRMAVRNLISSIKNPGQFQKLANSTIKLPTNLVVRSSTGQVAGENRSSQNPELA